MTKIKIPEVAVPGNYMMDPATELVIFGDQLRSGMVVVLEGVAYRSDPDSPRGDSERSKWCKIESIRFGQNQQGKTVCFIGLYADGSQRVRGDYLVNYGWIVKKNSIHRRWRKA